jgi:hypothetical protein
MAGTAPRVVAELGRPETPEETAARRAETSRKHRENQTALNLIVALIASLGIVLFLVVVVVRPEAPAREPVDYLAVATQTGEDAVAPVLPPEWYANSATFGTTNQVATWSVGLITPGAQFIALEQGFDANPTWVAAVLESAPKTGTTTIDGLTWTVYDQREVSDAGNHAYSLSTELEGSTVVLHGTASDAEFELLATAVAAQVAP